ncbi:hypothetical protein [Sanguibacter antarcticus]|uniref:Uncharacterized protein n=1 Tax=Sanguibacter antarcticus TaxID=372484 RepID=A0A2A9E3E3_9MICO|nr:hypothetical protein [Sanguibacter antarcticus]PFG32752.1 hypothetical protein ATL42_0600 [Sanguibacter antarcticus]
MGDADVATGQGTSGAHDEDPDALLASVAGPMIQILGLFLTVGAFLAWRGGTDVELPTVALVLAGVVVVVGAAFAWRGDALLGFVVSGRLVVVTSVFVVLTALVLAAVVLLPAVHLTLSTVPVAIVGVVSLVGPMVEAGQHRRSTRGRARAGARAPAPDRLFNVVLGFLVWQIPLAAVLLVGGLWLADVTG